MVMRDKDYRMERLVYDGSKRTWLIESIQMKVQKNKVAIHKYPQRVEFNMRKRESSLKKKKKSASQQIDENKLILKTKRQFLVI